MTIPSDSMKQFLSMQLDQLVASGMTYDNAVSRLLESATPDMRNSLGELLSERHGAADEWAERIRVTGGAGTTAAGPRRYNWYSPPAGGGLRWGRLAERMRGSGLAAAVESIDKSTNSIMKELAEPYSDARRRGIVIGNVQSGKTANYAALAAKALDARYKFVLVLSGIHNNLRTQTQERLNRDLGVEDHSDEWFQLTTPQHDLLPAELKNARANIRNLSDDVKMIAVMKKNSSRLSYLLEYLDRIDEQTMRKTPVLIIDDESDQATPDSSRNAEDDPTVINRKMREVWARVKNGTYVGYTATPFANVFMDPSDHGEGSLESLYPRDFIHVMPTPRNYFGAERLFGIRDGSIDGDHDEGLDVVRHIPRTEIPSLAPSARTEADSFVPTVTPSLQEAIGWFVVASAIRRMRGQKSKHSSMLIHTTHRVRPHQAMRDAIQAYLAPLKEAAREGNVEAFRDVFNREEGRVAYLYTGDVPAPTWPKVKDEIINVLRVLEIVVDNGEEDLQDRLVYSDEHPRTAIVIGGGTLSRGLTLEGLFVSFFTRTSNAYDTLLQMGRWFGYRPGYEDLQRIWLAEGLESDYQFLALVESRMREEIRRMTSDGLTPGDIGVRILNHPGRLEITAATKMKAAVDVAYSFQGYRTQTTMFDFGRPEIQESNLDAALSLLEQIRENEVTDTVGRSRLFVDVSFPKIRAFFESFSIHEQHDETHRLALEWVAKNLPDTPWRVVLASGGRDEVFVREGFAVKAVNRAPLGTVEDQAINIRALMSGKDRIADLVAAGAPSSLDVSSDADQVALRLRPTGEGGAGGEGLLVLYPISYESTAPASRGPKSTRMDMRSVLAMLDQDPLPDSDRPLIGYGLVLPSDVEGLIDRDGHYKAVVVPRTEEGSDHVDGDS